MYQLNIQTQNSLKQVDNPVEARIINSLDSNFVEVKDDIGNWKSIYRFYTSLSQVEQETMNSNIESELNMAIKAQKSYVFIDV